MPEAAGIGHARAGWRASRAERARARRDAPRASPCVPINRVPAFYVLARVSFLRRKTNNTQAPGLDTPRCVTLGGLYTAAERLQPAEQEQRPGEGLGVRCGVLARREGGAGVLPQKRCDWTGRRQNWPTVAGPHASRGAALLERGGPLRGRGRCWGDRDCRYGSISVCPAVRRGVGAAR